MRLVALGILFIFLLPAIGFILLIVNMAKKTAKSSWKGTVTDKLYNTKKETDKPNHTSQFFTLVVKTDEGLTRKIAVTKVMYDSCSVGDTLEKPVGKLNPVKVS